MAKAKLIRVLIMEGDADWINETLFDSTLNPETPLLTDHGTITEVCRLREVILPPPKPVEKLANPFEEEARG